MTEGSCKLVGQLRISGLVEGEVVTQMVPMKHMLLLVTSASRLFMMETRSADQMLVQPYFELSFSKRPEEELYDLRKDPNQIVNVANDPAYESSLKQLRTRVEKWMADTHDPRVDPSYDEWDRYPYHTRSTGFDEEGRPNSRRDQWAHRLKIKE